jgi:hypothetical protein
MDTQGNWIKVYQSHVCTKATATQNRASCQEPQATLKSCQARQAVTQQEGQTSHRRSRDNRPTVDSTLLSAQVLMELERFYCVILVDVRSNTM